MANYVLAYAGGSIPETEADQARVMEAWNNWYGELGSAIVDGGAPFGQAKTIDGNGAVSEAGAERLTGYTVISADSIDSAVTHAKGCPIFDDGGMVSVYETVDM
ncbi:MAG: hypothetical protein KJO36_02665 [Acidimicrobiia bacterium]|nr:hypothetical protein [Acidimicrobiia bacterium]MBT8250943.1 hypothetical protein [Acidimicrobiia bacterium]NNC42574.1 hypothetical protein [Acidimicrobiia bacterium]NNL29109.1 hypothetical protein [Acidimicrobiia bacterium]NNL46944.1 hypothetical protein [Acidimicrobiia bacterium]